LKEFAALPDRFNEQPLNYRRQGYGYVLYSVGANLKDDGGEVSKSIDKGDVVLRCAN
jgi:hypothetical protein